MDSQDKNAASVAIDLGAQSCRVSLLRWNQGQPSIACIHRFSNGPVATSKGLRWDLHRILNGLTEGLRACAEAAPEGIASVGVDGWAVDYVRLNAAGGASEDPFCYRDERNQEAEKRVHEIIPPERLQALTGIQLLSLNTLYQLYADKLAGADTSARWLNLPEYITYRLGGECVSEYTMATHTQLVRLGTKEWCKEIFEELGLNLGAAPKIVPTGTVVGEIGGELAKLPAFRNAKLVVPACHDTASAIAAIPASGDDWAFISSGTWSLVGTVLDRPCVSEEARQMNFTNLGGAGNAICFLRNVNGMWLLSQCMEEWKERGLQVSLEELLRECAGLSRPQQLINVDEERLSQPGNMIGKINAQLRSNGHPEIAEGKGGAVPMANLIVHSLAARYQEVLRCVAATTGKTLKRLFIVGGGSKNTLLNRLIAERTGLEVIVGSPEATTLGNFAIQRAALDGAWNASEGVTASAVAEWARKLGDAPVEESRARQAV